MNPERGALQGIGSKKVCFRLPVGDALSQLPVGLRPAAVLPVGGAPPQLPVVPRPYRFLPVGGVPPQLPVGLGSAGVLPVGAPPQLPVGLRPAAVLPVGGGPPCCRCRIAHCFPLV